MTTTESGEIIFLREACEDNCTATQAVDGSYTLELSGEDLKAHMENIRDHERLLYSQLIDLCGVDYQSYKNGIRDGARFAVVYHLMSIQNNRRLRVRCFCQDENFPIVPSMVEVWPAANWFEREAFDLFGIHFSGHPDLRRLLTDYGFVGHPFRKDFPISGYVEMRYDSEKERVIYQPVTIEPREIVPRVVREDKYAG